MTGMPPAHHRAVSFQSQAISSRGGYGDYMGQTRRDITLAETIVTESLDVSREWGGWPMECGGGEVTRKEEPQNDDCNGCI